MTPCSVLSPSNFASMLCIVCPNGCRINIEGTAENFSVSGNLCKRGIDFAKTEITSPVRTLTTTVRTSFSGIPVLPVRTFGEIPKDKIREVMSCIGAITVDKPLGIGDTVIENIIGLGVNVIVTSNIIKEQEWQSP